MENLKIHNWDKWQSYRKDRGQPPWIKIHRRVMRNPEWVSLTDAERGQLVAIWLLAADHNGVIPASSDVIQKLCYLTKPPDLNKFTDLGFIEDGWRHVGVTLASDGRQDVTPKAEAEADKKKTEKKTGYAASLVKQDLDRIEELCGEIVKKSGSEKSFNPYASIQKAVNKQIHPKAMIEALADILDKWTTISKPYAYFEQVVKIRSPNYYEQQQIGEYKSVKDVFDPRLADLVCSIIKGPPTSNASREDSEKARKAVLKEQARKISSEKPWAEP